jgi:hypothetical protein
MNAQSPALQGFVVSGALHGATLRKNLAPSTSILTRLESG